MNQNPSIYLSKYDHQVLRLLLQAIKRPQGATLKLKEELSRAIVLDDALVPADSVGINSEVHLEDRDLNEVEKYVLTLPGRANPDVNRVSVLAPLGVALLGVRAGDEFEWNTPGGLRRLKAIRVVRPPAEVEAHAPYSLS